MKITYAQLWSFLNDDDTYVLSHEEQEVLGKCNFTQIVTDFGMSENHIGGDDVCSIVTQALQTAATGSKIIVWYGPQSEVLIVGVDPNDTTVELVDYQEDNDEGTEESA